MTEHEKPTKRITLQLEEDVHKDLMQLVPHGFRRHLMNSLVRVALNAIKEDGDIMIGVLIAKEWKLVQCEPLKAAS